MTRRETVRPLVAAGTLLGMGMGGSLDGIVFHQVLQLHGMLSARLPRTSILNIEVNMFWDGLFHAATWAMLAGGLLLMWRAARRADVPWSGRCFTGALLLGWGLFNTVEGTIDHHLLQLHHVVEAAGLSRWDWILLASGVLLCLAGLALIRSPAARA